MFGVFGHSEGLKGIVPLFTHLSNARNVDTLMHNAFVTPPSVHFNIGIILIYFHYNMKVYV